MKALAKFHQELVAIYGYGLQVSTALQFWNKWLAEQISSTSTTSGNYLSFGTSNPNDPDATFVYRRSFGYLLDASGMDGETFVIHRKNMVILLYASWEDRYRQEIAREAGLKSKNDLRSEVFGDIRAYRHAIVHANGKLQSAPKVFLLIHEAQQGCRDATYEPSRFPVAVPYPSPHRATPAYVVVTSSDLDTSRNKASVSGLSWISRKVFCFFRKGQELDLMGDHLNVIFRTAVDECNQMGRTFFGVDPGFGFEEPLNTQ